MPFGLGTYGHIEDNAAYVDAALTRVDAPWEFSLTTQI